MKFKPNAYKSQLFLLIGNGLKRKLHFDHQEARAPVTKEEMEVAWNNILREIEKEEKTTSRDQNYNP